MPRNYVATFSSEKEFRTMNAFSQGRLSNVVQCCNEKEILLNQHKSLKGPVAVIEVFTRDEKTQHWSFLLKKENNKWQKVKKGEQPISARVKG